MGSRGGRTGPPRFGGEKPVYLVEPPKPYKIAETDLLTYENMRLSEGDKDMLEYMHAFVKAMESSPSFLPQKQAVEIHSYIDEQEVRKGLTGNLSALVDWASQSKYFPSELKPSKRRSSLKALHNAKDRGLDIDAVFTDPLAETAVAIENLEAKEREHGGEDGDDNEEGDEEDDASEEDDVDDHDYAIDQFDNGEGYPGGGDSDDQID